MRRMERRGEEGMGRREEYGRGRRRERREEEKARGGEGEERREDGSKGVDSKDNIKQISSAPLATYPWDMAHTNIHPPF